MKKKLRVVVEVDVEISPSIQDQEDYDIANAFAESFDYSITIDGEYGFNILDTEIIDVGVAKNLP